MKESWVSFQVPHEVLSDSPGPWQVVSEQVDRKRMTNEGDVIGASTTNVRTDGGKKNKKGMKQQKGNDGILPEPTPREVQTSHPPTIVDWSDEETGEDVVDITAGEEWIARVEMARQAVEILGRRLNGADSKFKTLEDFTLEENNNIRKELGARQRAEFETKETITSLEFRLMEALSAIESFKAEVEALKEDREVGGST